MTVVRPPAVAGSFYPDNPQQLQAMIDKCIRDAGSVSGPVPKAIIAPHAGYIYSGAVAARAYLRFAPKADTINRVILLGPCHRVGIQGLALPSAEAFRTPFGDIHIDQPSTEKILNLPQVQVFDPTHAEEHSLEVHLPFLQKILGDFSLVPLVVGDATKNQVAEVIDTLWGGEETVIVISSDLSHFLDYESAKAIDAQTCKAIETMNPDAIGRDQACGRIPVKGMLALAQKKGLYVSTLDICNSGDTAGSKDRVVGYGAWAFTEQESSPKKEDFAEQTKALLDQYGEQLLFTAGKAIREGLHKKGQLSLKIKNAPPALMEDGACFVTLKKNGQLRGCIGSPEAHQQLIIDVATNAYKAAFNDPRFKPLSEDELPDLSLSISVLSQSSPMTFADEQDFLKQLRPGIDGLIIEDRGRRALFLPAVWRQLPDKETFVSHLKQKAGFAADHWSPTFKAHRFIAEEVFSNDLAEPAAIWS